MSCITTTPPLSAFVMTISSLLEKSYTLREEILAGRNFGESQK